MALPALCAIAGAAYLVWATVLSPQDMESWTVWYSPLSRAADFGIGMGLAVLVAAGVRARGPLRAAFGVVSLATIVALVLTRPLQLQVGAWWHPAYAVAVAVGLAGIVLHDGPWSPVWDWRPLVWLGSLGYGIYLVHEPVMRLLGSHGLLPAARPGAFFLVSAVLVAVPSVLLARVSAGTLEPAGLRLLAMIDRRGRPRDYYEHLAPSDRQPAE
jgi:peptidoglycan/LPS O-acetylase OafA/YrhL